MFDSVVLRPPLGPGMNLEDVKLALGVLVFRNGNSFLARGDAKHETEIRGNGRTYS